MRARRGRGLRLAASIAAVQVLTRCALIAAGADVATDDEGTSALARAQKRAAAADAVARAAAAPATPVPAPRTDADEPTLWRVDGGGARWVRVPERTDADDRASLRAHLPRGFADDEIPALLDRLFHPEASDAAYFHAGNPAERA